MAHRLRPEVLVPMTPQKFEIHIEILSELLEEFNRIVTVHSEVVAEARGQQNAFAFDASLFRRELDDAFLQIM
jgi:hypothetical protein